MGVGPGSRHFDAISVSAEILLALVRREYITTARVAEGWIANVPSVRHGKCQVRRILIIVSSTWTTGLSIVNETGYNCLTWLPRELELVIGYVVCGIVKEGWLLCRAIEGD